jgi:hypothetical protein
MHGEPSGATYGRYELPVDNGVLSPRVVAVDAESGVDFVATKSRVIRRESGRS